MTPFLRQWKQDAKALADKIEARRSLTEAQRDWLSARPQYCLCGKPRAGVSFRECGTLYADGRFEPMAPMKVVRLESGCVLVGVPSDLYLTEISNDDL